MRAIVLAILLAVCSGGFTTGSAQSVATFKSSVEVVPINAVVRDRHGRIVTSLAATDFQIFDKGEPRSIVDFQVDRNSPISLAVLLDVSGSMRVGPKLALAAAVAGRLAGELQDGRDEVGVFTFDASLHEQQPFTVHPRLVETAFESADPWGTTSLYDAIAETARRVEARRAPRRAVVVLTDGVDTSSR